MPRPKTPRPGPRIQGSPLPPVERAPSKCHFYTLPPPESKVGLSTQGVPEVSAISQRCLPSGQPWPFGPILGVEGALGTLTAGPESGTLDPAGSSRKGALFSALRRACCAACCAAVGWTQGLNFWEKGAAGGPKGPQKSPPEAAQASSRCDASK